MERLGDAFDGQFRQHAVVDAHPHRFDVLRPLHLGEVHGAIGPRQQVVRELARRQPPLFDRSELQADDADVH